jgi:hypothetical protein
MLNIFYLFEKILSAPAWFYSHQFYRCNIKKEGIKHCAADAAFRAEQLKVAIPCWLR